MRSVNRRPLVLFFINGMVPSDDDYTASNAIAGKGAQVVFRNARLVDNDGNSALEECDAVAGAVPVRYKNVYPSADSMPETSGIGALKSIHAGEPGVTDAQAVHLDSGIPTGDPVEEERRRAYRGPAINEQYAAKATPGRLDPANAWGLPAGVPGAAHLTPGELSQVRSEQQGQTGWAVPMASAAAQTAQPNPDTNSTGTGSTGTAPTPAPGTPSWPDSKPADTVTGATSGTAPAASGTAPAAAPATVAPAAPLVP